MLADTAIDTMLFSLLHMAWMVVAFEGFYNIQQLSGMLRVAWVLISHFGASYVASSRDNKHK